MIQAALGCTFTVAYPSHCQCPKQLTVDSFCHAGLNPLAQKLTAGLYSVTKGQLFYIDRL